jgi:hypothetical protein
MRPVAVLNQVDPLPRVKVDHDASGLAVALDALQARERAAVAITPPVIDVQAEIVETATVTVKTDDPET